MSAPTNRRTSSGAKHKIDSDAISHGNRLVGWLRGRQRYIWVDRRTGAATARIAKMVGITTESVFPGPILARRTLQAPPLSWFRIPNDDKQCGTFIAALNHSLHTASCKTHQPRTSTLMTRVLQSDALHVRRQFVNLPAEWHASISTKRILLIDEREESHTDFCTPSRSRRQQFRTMIDAALAAHPNADFWLLRSSDSASGHWLSAHASLPPGTRLLNPAHAFCEVLTQVDAVYVVGASEGMGALLAQVSVYVYGSPYYAGWGLTNDDLHMPERTSRPSLSTLFEAIFVRFAEYLNPHTYQLGTLESALDCIELQHCVAARFAALNHVAGVRFQWWKRPYATPYLSCGGGKLRWVSDPGRVQASEIAAVWGGRSTEGLPMNVKHIRIEDGFIHSAGLGSDMSPPCSQVVDFQGMYFDARRPNDLTEILNSASFTKEELARAAHLRSEIVRTGVTKYNLGRRAPEWYAPTDKLVVLVAGQVSDDASIRLGTSDIATSEALLKEVRTRRPDAFIVYKPHPDVLSGNRAGLVDAAHLADIVDTDADLISLIDACDEVHVLSSLAGFDALMRNKSVHTYGHPFYAGWGLTHDVLPQSWRKRQLTLDMLTAGVLLRYAIYWDWKLSLFTTPESIVRQLASKAARPLDAIQGSRARPLIKAIRWIRNALSHSVWQNRRFFYESTDT
ncbi:capsular polysaccharide biosynthesis protein [Burkholderia cenocepacia]|uniref:capsular polysaccharide biosynthesis protein n=1 Tax=Burkholderia cenocepacia TaxID=95486 RepID=UPI000F593A3A|nr:capsular biosynthesis protein [Burkholderia cenocepacia]MBJ9692968.1 capsular biosynthesis protein [Burkholderia cenocepacia]MBR8208330.1 capsular biosynthesis protein [Burkholderia cenocepacia]RQU63363.1 capsular biosynthesis protein [Burkholderia cenocepacia]RQV46623.1 capsular biosynthesis protein [Burkholderia cenocepacia]